MNQKEFIDFVEKNFSCENYHVDLIAEEIVKKTHLPFRTAQNLIYRYMDDDPIDYYAFDYNKLLNPSFYTFSNCLMLYEKGYSDLIPVDIFLSKRFVRNIGIYAIPEYFDCDDKTIERIFIPSEIRYICKYAFACCNNLHEVIYENPNQKCEIREFAFYGTSIK